LTKDKLDEGHMAVVDVFMSIENPFYGLSKLFSKKVVTEVAHNGKDSAQNIASYDKLKADLRQREIDSVFDSNNKLSQGALENGKIMENIKIIKNPAVIKKLTEDGSSIADWRKKGTKVGEKEVHYYQNTKTGEVSYTKDYKTVIDDNAKMDKDISMTDKFRKDMEKKNLLR